MDRVPVFGNEDDIWIARGSIVSMTGRPAFPKRRIRLWEKRGKGPDGKRCADCVHMRRPGGTVKTYYKCGLLPITRGPATDIGYRDPACAKFEAPPKDP